jgi:3-hydroxymyristoyl/3-hydroxydecanoyl-(acyl carrier protein) dehydratase
MPAWHFTIPSDHPSLAGHFPGHPVAPGVVLLDEVLSRLSGASAGPARLLSAKFTAPVLPQEKVVVEWSELPDGRVDFACRVAERGVLRGRVFLPGPR